MRAVPFFFFSPQEYPGRAVCEEGDIDKHIARHRRPELSEGSEWQWLLKVWVVLSKVLKWASLFRKANTIFAEA